MGKLDFGYKPPTRSIHGWTVGGTHKAKYKVDEKNYPKVNREYLYIQCNCSLGYDHQAELSTNPSLDEVIGLLNTDRNASTDVVHAPTEAGGI